MHERARFLIVVLANAIEAKPGDVDLDLEVPMKSKGIGLSSEVDRVGARGALAVVMRISSVDVEDLSCRMA